MNRFLFLAGCFLIGVAISGIVSYSASILPSLRLWSFWLLIVVFCIYAIAMICDDYLCQYFEIPRQQFIALIIGSFLMLLIGGLIQWA